MANDQVEMLDDSLLAQFIDNFFGYGRLESRLWFVGMEEGGGKNLSEISKRLFAWKNRQQLCVDDLVDYHQAIGVTECFIGNKTKIQPTWGKLIRAALTARSEPVTTEGVRAHQKTNWARSDGNECLLELMPLPSPGTKKSDWLYGTHSKIESLRDRSAYRKYYSPLRAARIRDLISEHQPRVVVFYGKAYQKYWNDIAMAPFSFSHGVGEARRGNTIYFSALHPTARGVTNETYEHVGHRIKTLL